MASCLPGCPSYSICAAVELKPALNFKHASSPTKVKDKMKHVIKFFDESGVLLLTLMGAGSSPH